jgi:hypothetical protein
MPARKIRGPQEYNAHAHGTPQFSKQRWNKMFDRRCFLLTGRIILCAVLREVEESWVVRNRWQLCS